MTFRLLKYLAPAALIVAGFAAAPAMAAPLQKSAVLDVAVDGGQAEVTLIDGRDRHYRGDRGRGRDRGYRDRGYLDRGYLDRGYRDRGHRRDRTYYRGDYYRPYYPAYRAPRYVYAPPPAYYYPYDGYYPYSGFSYSSPGFGFSLGY